MRHLDPGPDGSTPLDPDEAADLLPSHITSRAELNAWEQLNIAKARTWGMRARPVPEILTAEFVSELHRRMFDDTWKWAGKNRTTAKSIGVPAHAITSELKNLLDDVAYWLEHNTYDIAEIAVRFHHRLVVIHPFANGNGRHSRLMVDILLMQLNADPFTWGSRTLDEAGEVRSSYIDALRAADKGSYEELLRFVQS